MTKIILDLLASIFGLARSRQDAVNDPAVKRNEEAKKLAASDAKIADDVARQDNEAIAKDISI